LPQEELRIRWAPKVSRERIWRLYQTDARGIVDEELIDDVGLALYLRCRSILMVTGCKQVPCPRCGQIIDCPGERWSRQYRIVCPACSWQATYGQYRDSWRHRDLYGGNAMEAFRAFVKQYEHAATPRERMLLIDRLIHAFHWSIRRNQPFRPAAQNLIEGSLDEVIGLLDRLTYGDGSTSGTVETKASWRETQERFDRWRRSGFPSGREGD
jgi:hypothetical protein